MPDVFVSHDSRDRDRIRPLVEAMEASGLSVWWSDRDIRPGESWDEAVEEVLEASRWVVTVWSRHSLESRWVRRESMAALEKDALLPVLLDGVQAPVMFRTTQAVDLGDWKPGKTSREFDAFIATLTGTSVVRDPDAPTSRAPDLRRGLWIAISLLVIAIGVSWIVLRPTDENVDVATDTASSSQDFTRPPMIAVLPFVSLGGDADDDLLADGLTDEIIQGLLQFRAFPVLSRHASFTFKGKQMDLREVAAQLEVAYVVAGTVRRLEERVRITAELSDASGRQIWAQSFDADLKASDIFAVQDEIAALIAGVTYPQLLISEIERVSDHHPSSLEAWGYALKALDVVYGLDMSRYGEAMDNVERALALDPNLAVVYWARGMLHFNSYVEDGILGEEAEARELQIIADFEKALEISPFDGASCGCLGWMYMVRGDMDSARVMFESAMEVNPNSALLRHNYSVYLLHRNDLDAARREAQLAVRLDPISPFATYSYITLGLVALVEGDIKQAIDLTRRALQLERTELFSQIQLPVLLYLDGQTVQAEAAFAELMSVHPNVTPRHRQLYSWLEPISGLMRLRVAEVDGVAADAMTTPDLVEHVFVQLGWEPPQ